MNAQQKSDLRKLLKEEPEEVLKALFKEEFWPPSLDTNRQYHRFEDDSCHGFMSVIFSEDGDAHVTVIETRDPNEFGLSQRFRMWGGGGQSLRVRKAMLFLALAIKWDNEEHPQDRGIEPQLPA